MANEIIGAKSHLVLITESAWGTKPGSPTRVYVPVEDYGVQFQHQQRQAKPYLGLFQRKHSSRNKGMPSGSISTSLYGVQTSTVSLAEYLLDWAMVDEAASIHEASALPSKTAEWAEGPDVSNVEHNGLRVNQATLAGNESSGIITLSLDVMGKTEVALATAATIPTDHDNLYEMEFEDCVFKINDGAGGAIGAIAIAGFQLQVQHNLVAKYNNSANPTLLLKTDRNVTFSVTLDKNTDDYDVFRRTLATETNFIGQLILQGLNNGSAADANDIWTIGTLNFPRLRFATSQDARNRDSIFQQTLNFQVLKEDDASLDMEIAWTEDTAKAS